MIYSTFFFAFLTSPWDKVLYNMSHIFTPKKSLRHSVFLSFIHIKVITTCSWCLKVVEWQIESAV